MRVCRFLAGNGLWRAVLVLLCVTISIDIVSAEPSLLYDAQQVPDTVLLAPVSAGQQLEVIHGYNDPLPGEFCKIGAASDHCGSQRYGLDLVPSDQSKAEILSPLPGIIAWITGDCLGIRTSDNLNLNVCHFGRFNVSKNSSVKRGTVLGTRRTSWIHLSLDDRYRNSSKPPIPFNGAHTLEGISFDQGGDRQRNVHYKAKFNSTNGSTSPAYRAQYINQSFAGTMTAGSTQRVQVHVQNTGSATWDANTKIAPAPRDQASPFYDAASWESGARIMSAGSVAPGQPKSLSSEYVPQLHQGNIGLVSPLCRRVSPGLPSPMMASYTSTSP